MKSNIVIFAIHLTTMFGLVGCQTVVSLSHSDLIAEGGREINAYDIQWNFLNFLTPELTVTKQLANQCSGGKVTGVETILYKREFILFQGYELIANARCQGGTQVSPP